MGMVRSGEAFPPVRQAPAPAPALAYDPDINDISAADDYGDYDVRSVVNDPAAWSGYAIPSSPVWEELAAVEGAFVLRKGGELFVATPVEPEAIVRLARG